VRFLDVTLAAAASRLPAQAAFYGDRLGLEVGRVGDGTEVVVGETRLRFAAGGGEPWYHLALLVPGDRFDPALVWAGERVELLPGADGEVVFTFEAWEARACYFHDPAGSIVELIAHRGVGERGGRGAFEGRELVGLSELGLVGDPPASAAALAAGLGLELWSGSVEEPGRLAFVGERARTLILASEGRGWLPTGRPAERHPVAAVVAAGREARVELEGGLHTIRSPAASTGRFRLPAAFEEAAFPSSRGGQTDAGALRPRERR
jgi:catechol 2,3-dioxygenase-like lactoylglutathione lyase family enzyme